MIRFARTAALAVALALAASTAVDAQQLPLKREQPPLEWRGCSAAPAAAPAASAEDRAEAARLAGEATEASILGDNQAVLALLSAAAERDPASARVAYLRARALELLDRPDDALDEYCRYSALAPSGPERSEVDQRVAALVAQRGFAVPRTAAEAFGTGVDHFDAGRLAEASAAFGAAAAASPEWAAATYNRGVTQLALGNTAAAVRDLRRYLELNPGADDLGAVLDAFASVGVRTGPNPATALAAGLVLPGLGHFTTGQPRRGAVFLAGAAGIAAVGLVATRDRVECLSPPVDGRCPADQVLREETVRPLLLPALLAAFATGVIGAVDAYRGVAAQAAPRAGPRSAREASGLSFAPHVERAADGARVTLLRVRF